MKRIIAAIGILFVTTQFAAADFKSGLKAYEAGNYKTALADWLKAGAVGDSNAQLNLGIVYENGVPGTAKNVIESLAWYRLAAAQNVAAGNEAFSRLSNNMSKSEIEQAEDRAIILLGKWFRQSIGRDEADYQAARKRLEQRAKEKIARGQAVENARAERQRKLVAQRDADARLAVQLEKESKTAAIIAAQERAEEAKRQALIRERREEEEKRLALLKEKQNKQQKTQTARARLAALKKKSKTGKVSDAAVNQQIAQQQKTARPITVAANSVTPTSSASAPSSAPAAKASTTPVASLRPKASSKAVVPSTELATPQTDNPVVASIFNDAKSVDLATEAAKSEIRAGKANIEALKWTLISAARGDASSIHMGELFKRDMTQAQIAESSRLAAIWINKRK